MAAQQSFTIDIEHNKSLGVVCVRLTYGFGYTSVSSRQEKEDSRDSRDSRDIREPREGGMAHREPRDRRDSGQTAGSHDKRESARERPEPESESRDTPPKGAPWGSPYGMSSYGPPPQGYREGKMSK